MSNGIVRVKTLNILDNIVLGTNVFVLGLLRALNMAGAASCVAACSLLFLGIFAFGANTSKKHEHRDEMARYHDGRAALVTISVVLVLVGVCSVCSMIHPLEGDLGAAFLMLMGTALVVYGAVFAMLEREDVYADYEDA